MRLSPGTEVVAFGVAAGTPGVRNNSGEAHCRKNPRKESRDAPNYDAMHSVLEFRKFGRIGSSLHATGDVTAKSIRSERYQHQVGPDKRTRANEASRHVGDAELTAKPIAKPKLFRTKANAAAAIAPAITGPQLSLKPVATTCADVSEIVILILTISAVRERTELP